LKEKIFVTLGTHPQQFDRLLKEVDLLVEQKKITGKVFCQTGHSSYKPKKCEFTKFLNLDDFNKKLSHANIVITHGGEGNVGLCKNLGKKMIVIPRRKEFGEHTNDHQLELAKVVEHKKLGLVAWDVKELGEKLKELKKFTQNKIARGKINELLEKFYKEELE